MELSKNVLKFVVAVSITIIAFILSHNVYFGQNPLFGIPYFGQTLISFAAGAFGIGVLPSLLTTVVMWFESVIAKTAVKVVSDIWEQQQKRLQDARKKKDEEKEKEQAEKENELSREPVVVLDTSAIIDGRVLDIVKVGFLDERVVIPRVVLDELQLISDSSDTLKRQRGRRGLDLVKELKKLTKVDILEMKEIGEQDVNEGVDKALLKIAKKLKGSLMTVDYNLNKVAALSGIKVLNVNELANAIKTVVLPGESMLVKVVQPGKEESQGVGYLSDGTMIVVEKGSDLIGKDATVLVSRIIQTPAGKMIFAKRV